MGATLRGRLSNIYRLGIKELWGLRRDPMMVLLIVYMFSVQVYIASTAVPDTLYRAPIAIVDEDGSPLASRIAAAFYPPHFTAPVLVDASEVDRGLDSGRYTFALDIPPNFQTDLLAGRSAEIQLAIDATRMSQAFTGNGTIQQIVAGEVDEFLRRRRVVAAAPVDLALRARFNPSLERSWFGAIVEVINGVTSLAIVLAGAALIREREHGTIEHLLVMPLRPLEIMVAKLWSMGLVVLVAATASLLLVVEGVLSIPVQGSIVLFLAIAALHVFAMTALGIFMATIARSMPQFGLLLMLTLLPLQMLSGGVTPRESMPALARNLMLVAPTTHFVAGAQAVLFRGAGIGVVWPHLAALAVIGSALFAFALARFRRMILQMG